MIDALRNDSRDFMDGVGSTSMEPQGETETEMETTWMLRTEAVGAETDPPHDVGLEP